MNAQYMMVLGIVPLLPEAQRKLVLEVGEQIEALVEANGGEGYMALALIASKLAGDDE